MKVSVRFIAILFLAGATAGSLGTIIFGKDAPPRIDTIIDTLENEARYTTEVKQVTWTVENAEAANDTASLRVNMLEAMRRLARVASNEFKEGWAFVGVGEPGGTNPRNILFEPTGTTVQIQVEPGPEKYTIILLAAISGYKKPRGVATN